MEREGAKSPAAARVAPGRGCRKDLMPIGAIVIRRAHGGRSRFIKVNNDFPSGRRWVLYARWWWEQNRGPVPKGKIVAHINGKRLDDSPENFGLRSIAHNITTKHSRNPEWSREQHRKAAAACGEFNRLAGKLNRIRQPNLTNWYPVVDRLHLVLDVPFRKRKWLLRSFGADVSALPANGHGPKVRRAELEAGVRAVLGRDLNGYLRVDPETEVGTGRDRLSEEALTRIAVLKNTDTWRRAEEAARLNLRDRK